MVLRTTIFRLVLAFLTMLIVSAAIFFMAEASPGDVAARVLGRDASAAAKQAFRERLHLDRPLGERYLIWIGGVLHGDFGESLAAQQPVSNIVAVPLQRTLFLAAFAFILYVPITLLLSILAAVNRERLVDNIVSFLTLLGLSLPEFVVGTLLIYLFAVHFSILPVMAQVQMAKSFFDEIRMTALPAITLMIAMAVYSIRMLRDGLIEVLDSEYVRMANLKGLPRWKVVVFHALPNAVVPALNTMALNLAYLIGGIVIVEQVFVYPGMGTLLVQSVFLRDTPVIEAVALFVSVIYILANLFADVMAILFKPALKDKLVEPNIVKPGFASASRRANIISRARRLPPTMLVGGMILLIYLIVAFTADYWAPYSFDKIGTGIPYSGPSLAHLLGTDQLGRDLFSRVILGTKIDLFLSVTGTLIATIIGGLLGLLSGLIGGWIDQAIMRLIDAFISIPFLILALLVIAAAGSEQQGSFALLILVIVCIYAPRIARMTRAVAQDLVTKDFITIARARGEPIWSIVWHELVPNATGVILVEFGVRTGYAPIFIGSLGFLGFGVNPPTPEWGLMISENRSAIISAPLALFSPAFALAVLVIGLNLFTDGMARVLGRSVRRGGA